MRQRFHSYIGSAAIIVAIFAAPARAQVPPNIEAELVKLGHIVDPACTARLYRPLMPANDYNTYWPPGAPKPVNLKPLYPGVTIVRDQSFGPNPKDLFDIFYADKGGASRPVLLYMSGGGGNKIEQQDRAGNAFYDNIGRWGTKNGMVVVNMQRHPGQAWGDDARDVETAVEWIKANIAKYKGDPNSISAWSQSAGATPLGTYVGHPEMWKNGVGIKAAIFMSGNPVPGILPPPPPPPPGTPAPNPLAAL